MSPINATSRMKINMPPIPQLRLSGANAKGLLKMYIEHRDNGDKYTGREISQETFRQHASIFFASFKSLTTDQWKIGSMIRKYFNAQRINCWHPLLIENWLTYEIEKRMASWSTRCECRWSPRSNLSRQSSQQGQWCYGQPGKCHLCSWSFLFLFQQYHGPRCSCSACRSCRIHRCPSSNSRFSKDQRQSWFRRHQPNHRQ